VVSHVSSSVLHDVDLSGCSPATVDAVSWHHPECGPEVSSVGHLDSRLESSVLPCGRVSGVDAARCEPLSVSSILNASCENERTVTNGDVLI